MKIVPTCEGENIGEHWAHDFSSYFGKSHLRIQVGVFRARSINPIFFKKIVKKNKIISPK